MKTNNKNQSVINYLCHEHKEKCSFVCLFKTCNHAFKVGCNKCKKDHAQHPNRLVPIVDFHNMLGKPIKYLQDISAFKLMNLKKKIEFIRNFRGYILQKEIELIQSNKNIKSIISSLLQEHYIIRDTVAHLDTNSLINNYEQYIENLLKCKDFMAYNPVKCELVFNNDVIKNSRISLEKQIISSHQLIDNIRQFLVKIIEVLLANCAHDEDDQDIEFVQEGDDKTNFNIYIKNRIDVIENPNIKSKLDHSTFLEMFDEQKQALTKQVALLEKEISSKSTILKKIKSLSIKDEQQILSQMNNSKDYDPNNSLFQNLHYQNEQLKFQMAFMKKQSSNQSNEDKLNDIKLHYQQEINHRQSQMKSIKQYCYDLEQQLKEKQIIDGEIREKQALNAQKIKKYQVELDNERQNAKKLNGEVKKIAKTYQQKINKLTEDFTSFQKKCRLIQLQLKKKKQQCDNHKANKINLQQKILKYIEIQTKYYKLTDQVQKKDKQISKLIKKIDQSQKSLQKMKQSGLNSDKQKQRIKEQYVNKQKMLKSELDKYQKQNEVLKMKSKNEEERCKNSENRMKQTLKQIQYKNELIRQKDKIIRQKEQQWNNKNQLHVSRVKELQYQLKNTRHVDNASKVNEDQHKKYRQIKQMFEMSIKKNQELKDRNYELQMQIQILKVKKLEQQKKNRFSTAIFQNGNHSPAGSAQQKNILHKQKLETNNSSLFVPQSMKIQTVTSQQYINSPIKQHEEYDYALKQIKMSTNKYERKQAYMEIKNLFNTVSEDMGILEERLKENSVIQKVYLKQLERKRNENKTLKKEIESMKVYANPKYQSQVNRSINYKIEKEKVDNTAQISNTNAPNQMSKGEPVIYLAKKKSNKN